jgi:hypothetical protein
MIVLATLSGVLVFHVGVDVVKNAYASSSQSELQKNLRSYNACVKNARDQGKKVACNYQYRDAFNHLMSMCYSGGGAIRSSNQKQSFKDACEQKYEYIEKQDQLTEEQNKLLMKLKNGRYDDAFQKWIHEEHQRALQNKDTGRLQLTTISQQPNKRRSSNDIQIHAVSNKMTIPIYEQWWDKLKCTLCYVYDLPWNPFVLNRFEKRTQIPQKLKSISDPKQRRFAIERFIALEIDRFHRYELMDQNGNVNGKLLGVIVRKDRGDTYTVQSNYNARPWTHNDRMLLALRSTSLLSCAFGFFDKMIKVKLQKQFNDVLGLFGKIFGCVSFGISVSFPIPGLWVVRKVTFY